VGGSVMCGPAEAGPVVLWSRFGHSDNVPSDVRRERSTASPDAALNCYEERGPSPRKK